MRHAVRCATLILIGLASSLGAQSGIAPARAGAVPAAAISHRGLWTTHHVGNQVFFELPPSALNTDILVWKREQGGWQAKHQIIRWERNGNSVALRASDARRFNDPSGALRDEERRPAAPHTVASFPLVAQGSEQAIVIDVTRLFTQNMRAWFSVDTFIDPARSAIEDVRAFPQNVVVTATRTLADGRLVRSRWNFVQLPARPMMPRLFDRRFGYMYTGFERNGNVEPATGEHALILRWRLEKKNPSQAVSEPVKPIVFYIDPATPPKWRPWIRRAIEAWQPAFEAIGFKNAIVAGEAPADADWSMDDVRYSVLYWRSTGDPSAPWAGSITDPRTGEFLQYHIGGASDNTVNYFPYWYFAQAGPLDARARSFPLPDSIRGALLQFVMTHEVAHTLGLRDGSYGKFAYNVDSVRSRSWIQRMGHTPSIINYSRLNYVAQPEDSIPPPLLFQRVGPADFYSIRWGYAPIAGARTAAEEKRTLDAWARVQDTVPMYRYNFDQQYGPDGTIENVETTDPVAATGLGVRNLRRIMTYLSEVTSHEGGSQASAKELYDNVLGQWVKEMWNVVALVGGHTQFRRAGHEARAEWYPVPADAQRRAVAFLDTAAFRTPLFLANEDATRRIDPLGDLSRIVGIQTRVLDMLFDYSRIHRLADAESRPAASAEGVSTYTLSEMMDDVRRSVWRELTKPDIRIDPYRQGLQQAYVSLLKARLDPAPPLEQTRFEFTYLPPPQMPPHLGAFERSVLRVQLQSLRTEVSAAAEKAGDPVTKAHLRLILAQLGTG